MRGKAPEGRLRNWKTAADRTEPKARSGCGAGRNCFEGEGTGREAAELENSSRPDGAQSKEWLRSRQELL